MCCVLTESSQCLNTSLSALKKTFRKIAPSSDASIKYSKSKFIKAKELICPVSPPTVITRLQALVPLLLLYALLFPLLFGLFLLLLPPCPEFTHSLQSLPSYPLLSSPKDTLNPLPLISLVSLSMLRSSD